jgi:uncharacterized membrane protein
LASDRVYRQRLEADLARWQEDGVISVATAEAIRGQLKPTSEGITIATVVAIVGGLLIAAAFLALIAANWTAIARPARFAMLLTGIVTAYTLGAFFQRGARPYLADLCVSVGAIIFGASIALVGQMYHLADDFAAGLLLWAVGALLAAALTESRGALAVALVAGCLWSGARVQELSSVHWQFIGFWFVAALLAWRWNAAVARHLVSIAAVTWWVLCAIGVEEARAGNPTFAFSAGAALLCGGGLALVGRGTDALRALGLTLSNYGAVAMAVGVAGVVASKFGFADRGLPPWALACAGAGFLLAFLGCTAKRWAGPMLAGVSILLALIVVTGWLRPTGTQEPWIPYALGLASMLCLVISGVLDDERPRVVAGWIGLAAVIAAITWAVRGSLLRRAAFLAAAGIVAVGLATVLGRWLPKERAR